MTVDPQLPRSAPEAQGIASQAILAFLDAAEEELQHLHSLMLVRHGAVVAEGWWAPYAAGRPHMLFSISKSFTATAIGFAVAEGLLTLDDYVIGFFPDDLPAEVSAQLAAMQVRHLLSMSTGHTVDTIPAMQHSPDGNWARAFLACPVERAPGTHFLYNTGASYMLSAIVQRLSGMTLLEYLQPRLFGPLGIRGATWEQCPRGVNTGGFGLSTTTEAVALLGQLLLQEGVWQGRQLLPAGWVGEATRSHIISGTDPDDDWAQGYGFQFWRCRHSAYRGDGAFGQFCLVLPEQNAVLAITAGLGPMQPVLNLVWRHLLPAFGVTPLPADAQAHSELVARLGALMLPLPPGSPTSPDATISGERSYDLEPNQLGLEALRLHFSETGCAITLRDGAGDHTLRVGHGAWQEGETSLLAFGEVRPVAAAGAWQGAGRYQVQVLYVETPFCVTLSFQLNEAWLLLDVAVNVSFGPTSYPQLVGHATHDP
jgi:CubicO group peptidase (beta-lactamase class C family)